MQHTIATPSPTGRPMDVRRSTRYQVDAPAFFWWQHPVKNLQQAKGKTRDISIIGVFVVAECAPSPGSHIEINVYLPAVSGTAKSVQLHGEGKVLRVEGREDAPTGFAAEVVFQAESSDGPTILTGEKTQ